MRRGTFHYMTTAVVCVAAFVFSLVLATASAASDPRISVNGMQPRKLDLVAGKSAIIDSTAPVKRVSLANPEIADAMVLSPKQVYVTGKKAGMTSLSMWGDGGDHLTAIFDVEVTPDANRLKAKLHEMLPNEKGIRVMATADALTLMGTVSSTPSLAKAIAIATPYAPAEKDGKAKINNLMEVGGVQQVMLEVRVSEMSRLLSRRMGFNFNMISASGLPIGLSLLDNLTKLPTTGGWPGNPLTVSDNVSGILSFLGGGATWSVFIDALKENGLIKVLAEPTLITLSGKSATFLAGGEFPIPVPQSGSGSTTITIEYKPFGVALNFTPTVLSNGRITMQVAPEVSDLDFSRAVSIQGYIIPSLTTRRVSTTVELADGQSFAIAGLLRDDVRESIRKFPLLGDLPILGSLFRSSSFQKNETELIIVVTPHLVKPIDMAKQTLPTEQFVEPDDFEFYLLGNTEGRAKEPKTKPLSFKKGGLEGDFGHIMP